MWDTMYIDARHFLCFILQNLNPLVIQIRTQVPECLFSCVWDLKESHMYPGKRQGFLWVRIWEKSYFYQIFQIHVKVSRSPRIDKFLFSRLHFGGIIIFIIKPTVIVFPQAMPIIHFSDSSAGLKNLFQRHLAGSVPRACDSESQDNTFKLYFGMEST